MGFCVALVAQPLHIQKMLPFISEMMVRFWFALLKAIRAETWSDNFTNVNSIPQRLPGKSFYSINGIAVVSEFFVNPSRLAILTLEAFVIFKFVHPHTLGMLRGPLFIVGIFLLSVCLVMEFAPLQNTLFVGDIPQAFSLAFSVGGEHKGF